jgi:hypothetical protein
MSYLSVNIHKVAIVKSDASGSSAWLTIIAEDGSSVVAFMPYAAAKAMADAYAAATTPAPEVEGVAV